MSNQSVQVKFPFNQQTWDMVITAAEEDIDEVEENSDNFVVTYATREEFDGALARFEGMIEYEELEGKNE